MHDRSLTRRLAMAALLAAGACPRAEAAACLYRGTDETARVVGSGEMITPFPGGRSAADCGRLKVASGSVDVWVLGADRTALASRRVGVDGGVLVRSSAADKAGPSSHATGLLQQFVVMLEGDQRARTGSSRGGSEDYPQAFLPTGRLARPDADLVVPLGPVPDANLHAFELWVDGRPVVRTKGPAVALTLPAAALQPGAHAVWKLDYGDKRQEGSFDVVDAQTLATLKESLAREAVAGDDATVARLRLASGLIEAGYRWDARESIRAALAP